MPILHTDAILFVQLLDDRQLTLVHPAVNPRWAQPEGIQSFCHVGMLDPPVDHQQLQHLRPAPCFPPALQLLFPKPIQLQLPPQLAA